MLVEQEGEAFLATEERIRLSARRAREVGDPTAVGNEVRGAPARRAGAGCCARSRSTSSSRTRPSSITACGAGGPYAAEVRAQRESLAEALERVEGVPEEELARRLEHVSLELVLTAHPTESTRRTLLRAHLRIAELLTRHDDPDLTAVERRELEEALLEEITLLWQTDEVRADRPRVGDEIRHGLWFFESSLFEAGERVLAEYRRLFPAARVPFSFGSWIGGDTDGNPEVNGETVRAALDQARATALARYRADVRELLIALASSRSLVGVSDELEESIARDERECVGYRDDAALMMTTERYRRKLSYMWWRLANDGYAGPAELLADIAIVRRSLEEHRGARLARGALARFERRVELFGFHVAKLDVRLHAIGGAGADGADTRRLRGGGGRPGAVRAAGARHRDRVGDDVRGGRAGRSRPDGRAGGGRPAVRDDRRPRERGGHRAGAARGRAVLDAGARRPRAAARGDGRLLRLRQGRRLPRLAVDDVPRAGGARGGRARARARADDLPRPRRQRRARRRPDPRVDPRAGARRAAGAPEADRAGRDDLREVRAARHRVPQPRGGTVGDRAERLPRAGRPQPGRGRA